ncbi:hypothetical protein [Ralstonia pickettii]|uniref:hypothetical protein n=1 Tax=Ralstonia pickettii TaxID=329 RepID=UPI0015E1B651
MLTAAGVSHPLLVTDRGLAATDVPARVAARLEAAGIRHSVFSEVEPERYARLAAALEPGSTDIVDARNAPGQVAADIAADEAMGCE